MENLIQKISRGAKTGLVTLLVPAMIGVGVAGCSREAPKRSESAITSTYVPYAGQSVPMWDLNGDGKIDLIRDRDIWYAVDTNIVKSYDNILNPAIMDSSMVELATKIARLQRELGFKIDSTRYYRGK